MKTLCCLLPAVGLHGFLAMHIFDPLTKTKYGDQHAIVLRAIRSLEGHIGYYSNIDLLSQDIFRQLSHSRRYANIRTDWQRTEVCIKMFCTSQCHLAWHQASDTTANHAQDKRPIGTSSPRRSAMPSTLQGKVED